MSVRFGKDASDKEEPVTRIQIDPNYVKSNDRNEEADERSSFLSNSLPSKDKTKVSMEVFPKATKALEEGETLFVGIGDVPKEVRQSKGTYSSSMNSQYPKYISSAF